MNLSCSVPFAYYDRPLHDLCVEDAVSEINAKLAVKSDVKLILMKEKHEQRTWTH